MWQKDNFDQCTMKFTDKANRTVFMEWLCLGFGMKH